MLQIISEAEPVYIGGGTCYADYVFDGGGVEIFLDIRDFDGTLADWAKGTDVISACLEDIHKPFDTNSEPWSGCYPYTWEDYCRYINTNSAN